MDILKDTLIVYGRIITILPLLLLVTIIMGKRSIGELPVFDFLVIITLGSVVGADIADPKIEHIHTATAIIGIGILQKIISKLTLRSSKIGKVLTFEPTIVIMDGCFINKNLRKIHYSIDNILQMLREKNVFDISEVKLGIIEANGKISIYKKPGKSTILREDMGINLANEELPYPIIMEGKIDYGTLHNLGANESWLMEQLQKKGLHVEDVFFATLTSDRKLHLSLGTDETPKYIKH